MTPSRIPTFRTPRRFPGPGRFVRTPLRAGVVARAGARTALLANPYVRAAALAAAAGPAVGALANYKRYTAKKKARWRVGERVGSSNAKSVSAEWALITRQDRSMYSHNITAPAKGDEINQRERNIINLRGVKICFETRLSAGVPGGEKCYFNMAMVTNKTDKSTSLFDTSGFFRAPGSTAREVNFNGISMSIDKHCLPINSDKFNILFHIRRKMKKGAPGFDAHDQMTIEKWVPIRRQIRYDNAGAPACQVWLVWWYTIANKDTIISGPDTAIESCSVVSYFREPKP